jgi:Allophanate hydrolase C-terminal domain
MDTVQLAVNGTLMHGFALNQKLLAVGATFVHEAVTAPIYRLWSIGDQYPTMLRVTAGGAAIALEVWAVPRLHLGTILLQEPPGLCLGKILLADQSIILGVLGEAYMCEGQRDITAWGGWRAYMGGGLQGGV